MTAKSMPCAPATAKAPSSLARLNDQFRQRPSGGAMVATAGVIALGDDALSSILTLVQDYDDFAADNDPYGEHDFGEFEWGGKRLFWKIDYFDCNMRAGSPDPLDASATTRVLTIMLASEY